MLGFRVVVFYYPRGFQIICVLTLVFLDYFFCCSATYLERVIICLFFFFFLVLVDLMLVAHVGTDCGRHLSRRLFGFVSVGVGVLWCVCAAVWVL